MSPGAPAAVHRRRAPTPRVVLDPFSGTGTTGLAARQLGRSYLGIDLKPAFHSLAAARLQRMTRQLADTEDPVD
ncbi:DNA methyltransferase [Streptomyces malaysiensis]|uniref:DNA methyltransferase n=1 Tax=Streptomyces malaysiensis TaxID=92644 RepID=UPI0011CEBB0C|nr:site-specific DNA-methyltransferase [Streptomyces malaysiensis]